MRRVLWELDRRQQIAAVAVILIVAFSVIAVLASSGFQATGCIPQKSALYAKWDNSLPLLDVTFKPGVVSAQADGFAAANGLRVRQANFTATAMSFIVDAPADKLERVTLACSWEQDPLVAQVNLLRPLEFKEDAV